MIKKSIKSREQAAQVAEELVQDLHQELDFYGSYQVKTDDTSDTFIVKVVSERSCNIITYPVVNTIMEVAAMYAKIYPHEVNYHLDVEQWAHDMVIEFIPAFTICVTFHDDKPEETK